MEPRCWKCGDRGHFAEECTDPEPPKWADVNVPNPEWVTWTANKEARRRER